jgi:hypothetical protein
MVGGRELGDVARKAVGVAAGVTAEGTVGAVFVTLEQNRSD